MNNIHEATIEAGHLYLYQNDNEPAGFSVEQQNGIELALDISAELGLSVSFLLFIDDFHGANLNQEWQTETIFENLRRNRDVKSALQFYQQKDIEPILISELALTSAAAHLHHLLLNKGVVTKGKKNLLSEFGGVSLITKDDLPTCSLIDAALYLRKIGASKDQSTISVLPERYTLQQNQVRNILLAFGIKHPPIAVIYHDQEGKITHTDDWSLKHI